jgi:hypothetical protein
MKVVIDATPKEIVETLGLLENRKNNAATTERVFSIPVNKLDMTHAASDYNRGMESYFVGPQSQCVGQPTIAGGDEYGK